MKKIDSLFLKNMGAFIIILSFSGSVTAGANLYANSLHVGFDSHRNQSHYKHNRRYGHTKKHNHHYRKHNVYGYYDINNNRHRGKHSYPSHAYYRNHRRYSSDHRRYNQSYSSYRKPCHQVSKVYYDEDGSPHNTAGTMCYDQYGVGYIVSGSRYRLE